MEVRRGRYLKSFENPEPLRQTRPRSGTSRCATAITSSGKRHRIMVQVQSTWFPLIDRNPQKYVPSIYQAAEQDFVKATQRIYRTPAISSHLMLPVIVGGRGPIAK